MAEDGAYDAYEDWQLVGDAYYSRRELYALDWGGGSGSGGAMNLAFMRCAAPAACACLPARPLVDHCAAGCPACLHACMPAPGWAPQSACDPPPPPLTTACAGCSPAPRAARWPPCVTTPSWCSMWAPLPSQTSCCSAPRGPPWGGCCGRGGRACWRRGGLLASSCSWWTTRRRCGGGWRVAVRAGGWGLGLA